MGDVSTNYNAAEFDCRDGCGYGAVHPRLVKRLERLRRRLGGKPLPIRSGIRCGPRNAAVGGSTRSAHMWGGAADIPSGLCRRADAIAAGFTGIGERAGWVVHVDVRRTREPVIWQY